MPHVPSAMWGACLALLFVLAPGALALDAFEVGTCAAATQYFDTSSISCVACSPREPDADNLNVIGFASRCECPEGFKKSTTTTCDINAASKCGPADCESCLATSQAVDRARTRCMGCDGTTSATFSASAADCTCPANFALVETTITGDPLTNKQCVACPAGSRVFTVDTGSFKADRYTCQSCPDPNMEFDGSNACVCKSGYTAAGVETMTGIKCILTTRYTVLQPYLEYKVTFNDVAGSSGSTSIATVNPSLTFSDLLMPAAVQCFNWEDETSNSACQTLSNLCVLRHYLRDAKACELMLRISVARGGSVHGWASWADTMPQLYYSFDQSSTASTITNTLDLGAVMSFDEQEFPDTHEFMAFKLVRWSLTGELLGVEDLSNQFTYCDSAGVASSGTPRFLKYGVTVTDERDCDLRSLIGVNAPAQEFYDLYVVDYTKTDEIAAGTVDESTGLPTYLYPVPVRNVNYISGANARPNVNDVLADEEDDELVRRFFLFDRVSGVTTAGSDPEYIRFASKITLTIPTQLQETARIRPPVLTIEYADRQVASFATDSSFYAASVEFTVQYTTDLTDFWTTAVVLLSLAMVVVVMSCCLRMFNWCGRNTRSRVEQVVTIGVLIRSIVYFCGNFGRVVFWLVVALAGYWLMFFKLQDSAFTMLPAVDTNLAGNDYDTFNVMIILCFVGLLIRVTEIVYEQSQVDIFFVDWERDKNTTVHTHEDDVLDAAGDVEEAKGGAGKRRKRVRYPQVSAWRSILAANEFSEMQTTRKTSLNFTLLILLFFLRGVGLEYVATPQPTATDLTPGPTNPVLLFALVSLLWLGINLLQVVWNVAVYERWFSEPCTERFVDLLTLAKVSVMALTDRYHGFYLHCRSSHTYADANMAQLTNQLQQEADKEKQLPRGLENCPDGEDLQLFEMFVTENWRNHYDRILGRLAKFRRDNRDPMESNGIFSLCLESKRSKEDTRALLKATALMLDFLKGFIDETDPNFSRRWLHRVWYFRIFNIPPEFVTGSVAVSESTRMYGDPNARWESILFRGVELDLMMFNILTFAIGMLMFNDTVVSTIWVFLTEALLCYLRMTMGIRNIANKALVDDRFLK